MMNSAAPSSGQSTFWSRRRSIRSISRTRRASTMATFSRKMASVDLPRDGRRDLAALAAALDQHHHDVPGGRRRGRRRRTTRGPGPWSSRSSRWSGPCRSCPRSRRRAPRASAPVPSVDHRGQRVAQEGPDDRREVHPLRHLARRAVGERAVRALDALDQPRLPHARRRWRPPPSCARSGAASPGAAPARSTCSRCRRAASARPRCALARREGHQPEAARRPGRCRWAPPGRRPARSCAMTSPPTLSPAW